MKHTTYWMMAGLALCWLLMGCGDSKPAAQDNPAVAAAPAEVAAPVANEAEAPVEATAEAAAPTAEATVVVAKVNGTEITEADIQKVQAMFMKQMGGRIPPDQMATALPKIRERILEELIMRNVMLAEVAKQGISLSDSEFAEVKAELAQELPEGTTLESYMAETGTTEAEMREQMAVRKMVMAKAESLAKPTDEEIQKFYDENKEGFSQGESVTASHILIKVDPKDDDAAKAAKRERIEGLRKQLLEGADFAELAKANSDCPSASGGGDLGSFGRGQMVPEFEDAAFSQPVGSVGDVVETQFGYHLIKVAERSEAKELDFNEVKSRINETLYSQKQQDAVREYVDGLRSQAKIERFDAPPADEALLNLDVEDDADPILDEDNAPDAESVLELNSEDVGSLPGGEDSPVIMEVPAEEVPVEAEPVVEKSVPAVAEAAPAAEDAAPADEGAPALPETGETAPAVE